MTGNLDQSRHAHGCSSFADGHQVHYARARKAFRDADLGVGALVRVVDINTVELSWDGVELDLHCHDADTIARVVDAGGDIGTWVSRWRVLILPGENPRNPATFTLAAPGHWLECVPDRVPASTA